MAGKSEFRYNNIQFGQMEGNILKKKKIIGILYGEGITVNGVVY